MAAGDGDRVDGFHPQFVGDLPDLFHLEPAQIVPASGWCREAAFY